MALDSFGRDTAAPWSAVQFASPDHVGGWKLVKSSLEDELLSDRCYHQTKKPTLNHVLSVTHSRSWRVGRKATAVVPRFVMSR